jgi:hypothetical protein
MGKGIDVARGIPGSELHADVIENFRDQLLIVFLKRLKHKYGDDLVFPVTETDATGQDMLAFKIDGGNFVFVLEKKS